MRAVAKVCLTQNTHKNIVSVFDYGHLSSFLYSIDTELWDLQGIKNFMQSRWGMCDRVTQWMDSSTFGHAHRLGSNPPNSKAWQ